MGEHEAYQIQIQGWIGERWAGWFDGMTITFQGRRGDSPVTVLSGPVVDQAALRSLLLKVWDLGLTVISVARVETSMEQIRRQIE